MHHIYINFRNVFLTVTGGVLLLAQATVYGKDLSPGRAESVGMSTERLARITELSQRYVDEGKLAGVLTMVARNGKIVHFEAVGHRGVDDSRPLEKDALFRIYSMSKPITAVAAMILYEEGKFQLRDPVSKFLPELKEMEVIKDGEAVPLGKSITMQQLLSHTAGFSYGFTRGNPVDIAYQDQKVFEAVDLNAFVKTISAIPLLYEPGTRWHYSIAVDLTGAVIERISGQRFDRFLAERIFEPLGMTDTFFDIPDEKMTRFLPNHGWDRENEKLIPFVEQGYPLYQDTTFFSGGGGLVSTAMDYLRFAEMLRQGGELDGQRLLSPKTVQYMTTDHLPAAIAATGSGEQPGISSFAPGLGFGLGFGVVKDTVAAGVIGSPGEYSWGGAAGTIFWVDPVEEMVVVGMIQQMGSPWPLRAELKVLANQALIELQGD
ncbi:MAG: serine hydrolase [Gammaproteobacteria bacterium]|nr:serine hydrolase [Gammaproteobacteria bacterium]